MTYKTLPNPSSLSSQQQEILSCYNDMVENKFGKDGHRTVTLLNVLTLGIYGLHLKATAKKTYLTSVNKLRQLEILQKSIKGTIASEKLPFPNVKNPNLTAELKKLKKEYTLLSLNEIKATVFAVDQTETICNEHQALSTIQKAQKIASSLETCGKNLSVESHWKAFSEKAQTSKNLSWYILTDFTNELSQLKKLLRGLANKIIPTDKETIEANWAHDITESPNPEHLKLLEKFAQNNLATSSPGMIKQLLKDSGIDGTVRKLNTPAYRIDKEIVLEFDATNKTKEEQLIERYQAIYSVIKEYLPALPTDAKEELGKILQDAHTQSAHTTPGSRVLNELHNACKSKSGNSISMEFDPATPFEIQIDLTDPSHPNIQFVYTQSNVPVSYKNSDVAELNPTIGHLDYSYTYTLELRDAPNLTPVKKGEKGHFSYWTFSKVDCEINRFEPVQA